MNLVAALKHLPVTAQPLFVKLVVDVVDVEGVSMGTALRSGNSYPVKPIKGELIIGTIVVVATKHKWFKDVTDSPPDYIVKRVAGINVCCLLIVIVDLLLSSCLIISLSTNN